MEILVDRCLREEARVKRVPLQEGPQRTAHHITRRVRRQAESRTRVSADVDDLVVENDRRRCRNVQQNVVERWVVCDRVTSADDRIVTFTEEVLGKTARTPPRAPGEPESGC